MRVRASETRQGRGQLMPRRSRTESAGRGSIGRYCAPTRARAAQMKGGRRTRSAERRTRITERAGRPTGRVPCSSARRVGPELRTARSVGFEPTGRSTNRRAAAGSPWLPGDPPLRGRHRRRWTVPDRGHPRLPNCGLRHPGGSDATSTTFECCGTERLLPTLPRKLSTPSGFDQGPPGESPDVTRARRRAGGAPHRHLLCRTRRSHGQRQDN